MVNQEHLAILKKGVDVWNNWREENSSIIPDLSGAPLGGADLRGVDLRTANLSQANLSKAELSRADFSEANLSGANFFSASLGGANLIRADLRRANLSGAYLSGANLGEADLRGARLIETKLYTASFVGADLSDARLLGADLSDSNFEDAYFIEANLRGANLMGANLTKAKFSEAKLIEANLRETKLDWAYLDGADLSKANLSGADLTKANLSRANLSSANIVRSLLIEVKLNGANLTGCRVYGVSAWGIEGLEEATQRDLIITPEGQPKITVDNLEVAQFIYIMLHSEKVRGVIDTLTSKAVLILGRFTPERKASLDSIREELRKRNYVPILFDFEKPSSKNLTETISTLAHMARFIIADITDAKSIPQELMAIVPFNPSVPVQPILLSTEKEYAMFESFKPYPWVLQIQTYNNQDELLKTLSEKVIAPAENKAKEMQKRQFQ